MIAYHCDLNTILQAPFSNRKNKHRILAYSSIMKRLADCGYQVDVKILDNEVSAEFKRSIVDDWGTTYQLVPPNVHRRNISEKDIRTFKAHLLSVLAGVDPAFPKFMWDSLLVQTELTLNLLRQSTLNPRISVWENFNGAFDYIATLLGPIRCKIFIHTTSNNHKPWDQRGREGFSVGPALHHYRCIQAIDSFKKALLITDIAEYLHDYLTQLTVTSEGIMPHAIHFLYAPFKDVPTSLCDPQ